VDRLNIHDNVVSQDGALKATLAAFEPKTGKGRLKIDYKTYDLKKTSEYPFTTNRNDAIKKIAIVRVPAD
jgi:hypothetical protein